VTKIEHRVTKQVLEIALMIRKKEFCRARNQLNYTSYNLNTTTCYGGPTASSHAEETG